MPHDPIPHPDGVPESLTFHDLTSADGTRLVWWDNEVEGPPVLHCPGIGTPVYSWPGLLRPECGLHAFGWHHRGVHGSDRPADPSAVTTADFVDDAIATLDAAGVERAVLAGWSIGVNTMVEVARRHPDRVAGLFGVAGVPGDTFGSVLGAVPAPRWLRRVTATTIMKGIRATASTLGTLSERGRRTPTAATVISHSGVMLPSEDLAGQRRAIYDFLDVDLDWYMTMGLELGKHPASDLRDIEVPVHLIAGRWDVLSNTDDIRAAALSAPQGTFELLSGSHFIAMEQPEAITRRLRDFVDSIPRSLT